MPERTLGEYRLERVLPSPGPGQRLFLARHRGDDHPANEQGNGPRSQQPPAPAYFVKAIEIGGQKHEQLRLAQFRHEAFLFQHFCHEGIPTLHDQGEAQGLAYMVLDYIEGCNLADLLALHESRARPVSKEIAVYLCAQVASALHHVHRFEYRDAQGNDRVLEVLHRDLSPNNILISRYGDVYLTDFGSAQSEYMAPELAGIEPGTLGYKAPERLTVHGRASVQSDLFSMAVLLWELLRGQRCFVGPGPAQIAEAILGFDLQKKEYRVPGLSAKLSEVLRKNLDRNPKRRFASAFAVLSRLAQSPEAEQAAQAKADLAQMVRARLDGGLASPLRQALS